MAAEAGGSGLAVVEVTVRFGGLTALDSVSMSVEEGEVVGIIGPNGAGKTTLFNAICGFVKPTLGHLEYRGRKVKMRPHQLRSMGIARTLQGVGLWPGLPVIDNVLVGERAGVLTGLLPSLLGLPMTYKKELQQRDKAETILAELGLSDCSARMPHSLPYAFQKRVAMARALMSRPRLLLLDEPASGLGEDEMSDLGDLIRRLGQQMGVMLVEHHMDLVMAVCDRVIVLDFGQVIASGPPEKVRNDPAVTAAYLGEEVLSSEQPAHG